MNKRILVVGGAGYIGSHMVLTLIEHGCTPIIYDNFSTGHAWFAKGFDFVRGDLCQKDLLVSVLKDKRIDAVMHFAAKALVEESMKDPLLYFRENVANSITLLEAMKEARVPLLVFSSSCAVYGIPSAVPISEDTLPNPINPYGETKLMIERMLTRCSENGGIRFVSLRYFNAAGADTLSRTGECHCPETHIIPLILEVALKKRPCVHIFGNDYPTPDGTCIRDYIHVTDLAEAHMKALEYLNREGESQILNLGTEKGYSVKEVIDTIEKVSGVSIPYKIAARRPGDPPVLVASVDKASRILGWSPKMTDISSIIETAWKWHLHISSIE